MGFLSKLKKGISIGASVAPIPGLNQFNKIFNKDDIKKKLDAIDRKLNYLVIAEEKREQKNGKRTK